MAVDEKFIRFLDKIEIR